jgi:hypothetical protein
MCQKFWDPIGDKSWRWWTYVLIVIVVAVLLLLIAAIFTDPFSEGVQIQQREPRGRAHYVHHSPSYSRYSSNNTRRRHNLED